MFLEKYLQLVFDCVLGFSISTTSYENYVFFVEKTTIFGFRPLILCRGGV